MTPKKFHLYLANLNPQRGTEPGKVRPVVVVQTNLLNDVHPSTIICPMTTNVRKDIDLLRVHVPLRGTGLEQASDILVDQVRAIDIARLLQPLGMLQKKQQRKLMHRLQLLLLDEVNESLIDV